MGEPERTDNIIAYFNKSENLKEQKQNMTLLLYPRSTHTSHKMPLRTSAWVNQKE